MNLFDLGSRIRKKYESLIVDKDLYGFSTIYFNAMSKLESKQQKRSA